MYNSFTIQYLNLLFYRSVYAKKAQKKNLKRVSYKYLAPYVSKNGHLCFIGYVNYYGGAEKGYRLFDATSKKFLA